MLAMISVTSPEAVAMLVIHSTANCNPPAFGNMREALQNLLPNSLPGR